MWNKLFGIDMQTKKEKDDIILNEALNKKYEYGFTTDIEQETLPPGLDENVIKTISKRNKNLLKDKSSNSLIALGAMEVHLNMALQALNAFKKDSKD